MVKKWYKIKKALDKKKSVIEKVDFMYYIHWEIYIFPREF